MRACFLFLSAMLIGCAGGGHIDVGVGASSELAQPQGAPDAPRLVVTVARVDVHVAGEDDGPAETDADADAKAEAEAGWTTVFTGPAEVDLRDAAQSALLLGGGDVPAGKVTQIRLILDGDAELVTGAAQQTIRCPSCTQTGLKIVTRGSVVVGDGETLRLDLVFDTVASVVTDLDGLRLNPVITLDAHGDAK